MIFKRERERLLDKIWLGQPGVWQLTTLTIYRQSVTPVSHYLPLMSPQSPVLERISRLREIIQCCLTRPSVVICPQLSQIPDRGSNTTEIIQTNKKPQPAFYKLCSPSRKVRSFIKNRWTKFFVNSECYVITFIEDKKSVLLIAFNRVTLSRFLISIDMKWSDRTMNTRWLRGCVFTEDYLDPNVKSVLITARQLNWLDSF